MFDSLKRIISEREREKREREELPEVKLARACEEIERAISAGDEKTARRIATPIRKEIGAACVRRLGKCEGCLYGDGSVCAMGRTVCAILAEDATPQIKKFFDALARREVHSANVSYCRNEVDERERRYMADARARLAAAETAMQGADDRLAAARAAAKESLAKVGVDVELPD